MKLRFLCALLRSLPTCLGLLGLACGGSEVGSDGDEAVPGHCFVEASGNCECSASDTPTVGTTQTGTCDSSEEKLCCASPFEGSGEPYNECSCYAGNSSCGGSLVQVSSCDQATYHHSGGTGTSGCDQCQSDTDCDYGCAASEVGVCSHDSGCGSCSCQ